MAPHVAPNKGVPLSLLCCRVDAKGEGYITVGGLMTVFQALGQPLTLDDAHLLMARAQATEVTQAAGELAISRDQLLDLFEVSSGLFVVIRSTVLIPSQALNQRAFRGEHFGSAAALFKQFEVARAMGAGVWGATLRLSAKVPIQASAAQPSHGIITWLQGLNERQRQTGRMDAMERYQNVDLEWPTVDVTGDKSAAPSRNPSFAGAALGGGMGGGMAGGRRNSGMDAGMGGGASPGMGAGMRQGMGMGSTWSAIGLPGSMPSTGGGAVGEGVVVSPRYNGGQWADAREAGGTWLMDPVAAATADRGADGGGPHVHSPLCSLASITTHPHTSRTPYNPHHLSASNVPASSNTWSLPATNASPFSSVAAWHGEITPAESPNAFHPSQPHPPTPPHPHTPSSSSQRRPPAEHIVTFTPPLLWPLSADRRPLGPGPVSEAAESPRPSPIGTPTHAVGTPFHAMSHLPPALTAVGVKYAPPGRMPTQGFQRALPP